MTIIDKLMFYIFIIYPVIGYITITYYGLLPVYFSSIIVFFSFVTKFSIKRITKFPTYLKFYTLYMVSVIFSKYFIYQIPLKLNYHMSSTFIIFLIIPLFLIIENTTFSDSFIINCKKLMTYVVFAAAFVSIIQYFSPYFFVNSEKYNIRYAGRILSIFTWGDLINSRYITIGFAIFYGILIVEYKNKRLMSVLLVVLVGIVVLLSQTRAVMLTYLITTLMLVFNKMSFKSILYLLLILSLFYTIVDLLDFDFGFFVENRLKSESALTRIEAFKAFSQAFPEHPFFGTGGEQTEALFKGYGHVSRLHNAHLGIAYYYGIFAFIFHTLFLISLMKKSYITAKKANYWPFFVGMICYIAATMTMPGGEFFEPGLIFMIVFNKYYFDRYQLIKKVKENDEINKTII